MIFSFVVLRGRDKAGSSGLGSQPVTRHDACVLFDLPGREIQVDDRD